MDEKYFAEKIEEKWRRLWEESGAFEAGRDPARGESFRRLGAPAFPPGPAHLGHFRDYAVADALCWFERLRGPDAMRPGLADFGEPSGKLLRPGAVVAETFYRDEAGQRVYFNPLDVDAARDARGRLTRATLAADGRPVSAGPFERMSESVNNVVEAREMFAAYGADATRLFVLFAAPVGNELRWREAGVAGALRFLRRIYSLAYRRRGRAARATAGAAPPGEFSAEARRLRRETHRTIARVTADIEGARYHTAAAALMRLSRALGDFEATPEWASPSDIFAAREASEGLVLMLAPFAPHAAEEMWEGLGHAGGLLRGGARWPSSDERLAREEELEIAVQVNGSVRARVVVDAGVSDRGLREAALADERVRAWTRGRRVVETFVVPGRLVNVVVR